MSETEMETVGDSDMLLAMESDSFIDIESVFWLDCD